MFYVKIGGRGKNSAVFLHENQRKQESEYE